MNKKGSQKRKLSIIVPVFNERKTLPEVLRRIERVKMPGIVKEVILVDDGSTDGTREIIKALKGSFKVFYHEKNLGKGAAIRTALKHAGGEIVIIQDADLEYSPEDYPKLIKPILQNRVSVVYGSRVLSQNPRFSVWYHFGGRLINRVANLLYGSRLTDINSGYKVFKRDIFDEINLEGNRFEFCEEVTAKILKKKYEILEVPIRYTPRSFKEGKKLTWKDGFSAIVALVKYRLF